MRIALIGFGAIGQVVAAHIRDNPNGTQLCAVLVRSQNAVHARRALPADVSVIHDMADMLSLKPDLIVECAGHEAVRQYAADILTAGVDLMIISTGALAAPGYIETLSMAIRGAAQIIIPAGAIAGLDGLGALKIAGLSAVTYTSVKPPLA
ncbi:MAG: Gfo/Idh/MocA family oxidoreductase, partial [Beijerinckiaceae bacterium]